MRILHLSGEAEDVGGVLSVIRNLRAATDRFGWEHTVAVHSKFKEVRKPSLDYWRTSRICSDSPRQWEILVRAGWSYPEVRKYLKETRFDMIHVHSRGMLLVGAAIALFLKRPVIYTNHGYSRRTALYRWVSEIPRFHTVMLTPNMAKHYDLAVQSPKVTIISECCADSFFAEPLVASGDQSRCDRVVKLVGVGNIMRWKNWHLIARAMARMTPAERNRIEFSLWGPTPQYGDSHVYEKELRAFVSKSGLDRQFLFRGPTLSVSDCLRRAEWFVLPSTNEPCSVALIEALALGLPALVSATGGNVDILRNGKTGLLFAPEDIEDLAFKLRVIANHTWSGLPPERIRESVLDRSASCVARQYEALFTTVLNRNHSVPAVSRSGPRDEED